MKKRLVAEKGGLYKVKRGFHIYKIIHFAKHYITGELMIVFSRFYRNQKDKSENMYVMSKDEFLSTNLEQFKLDEDKKG